MIAVILILPVIRAAALAALLAWGGTVGMAAAVNRLSALAMSAALISLGFIGLRRGRTTRDACCRALARDAKLYTCAGRGSVQDEELQLIIGLHLRGWTWDEIGARLGSNADNVEQRFIRWDPQNRRIR
jgi:hypothetical protein